MKLLYYPNKQLDTPTKEVINFDETLIKILGDMALIMKEHNGLGLSANQVGIDLSMFIIKDSKDNIHEIINPKLLDSEGLVSISEGCLSFPGIYIPITRGETIELSYQNKLGEIQRGMAYGMEARTILHELEHLQGINYLSKVNRATRKAALSQLKKNLK